MNFSWIDDLQNIKEKVYSQGNQDGIIKSIFEHIGTTNKYCVEFGYNSNTLVGGSGSNVARLVLNDWWDCLLLDCDFENPVINLYREFLTPKNICEVFKKYAVPQHPDYVSIDVDSTDLWLMKAMLEGGYRPRLISVEYNANFPLGHAYTVLPGTKYTGDMVYGASFSALDMVAWLYDYGLIAVADRWADLFFVRRDIIRTLPFSWKFKELTGIQCHKPTTRERLKFLVQYPSLDPIPEEIIKNNPNVFRFAESI
jgi:hypothetical protein